MFMGRLLICLRRKNAISLSPQLEELVFSLDAPKPHKVDKGMMAAAG